MKTHDQIAQRFARLIIIALKQAYGHEWSSLAWSLGEILGGIGRNGYVDYMKTRHLKTKE